MKSVLTVSKPLFSQKASSKIFGRVQSMPLNWILRKKCLCSEFSWLVYSCIRTEYGIIRNISLYSVQMWENADRENLEYRQFSRSEINVTETYSNKKPSYKEIPPIILWMR